MVPPPRPPPFPQVARRLPAARARLLRGHDRARAVRRAARPAASAAGGRLARRLPGRALEHDPRAHGELRQRAVRAHPEPPRAQQRADPLPVHII